MPDPTTPEFWRAEQGHLWDAVDPLVMRALAAGAAAAAESIPAGIAPLVDWQLFNLSALDFLQAYRLNTVQGITATTRDRAIKIINDWVRAGDTFPMLRRRLAPLFGTQRAEMIAATEVTRIFARGNLMLWETTGVVSAKRWQTARDERVCIFCGPLHGTVVEVHADFELSAETVANSTAMKRLLGSRYNPELALDRAISALSRQGKAVPYPPYHPRCRCWLQPVVSVGALQDVIGDVLAQQFFADVKSGKYAAVAARE